MKNMLISLSQNRNQISTRAAYKLHNPINISLAINIDRAKAAQLGVDMSDISRSLIASYLIVAVHGKKTPG